MKFHPRPALTLVEILFVVWLFGIIFTTTFALFQRGVFLSTDARRQTQLLTVATQFTQNLRREIRGLQPDHEEFRNRATLGCDIPNSLDPGPDGHCQIFSNFWNGNSLSAATPARTRHQIFGCTTDFAPPQWFFQRSDDELCRDAARDFLTAPRQLSFGQFRAEFRDTTPPALHDSDDRVSTGDFFAEISQIFSRNFPEFYGISPDSRERILLRRVLLATGDRDGDGQRSPDESRFWLQILRLSGFFAGADHDFSTTGRDAISLPDTRACRDCAGQPLEFFPEFSLPADTDDGRTTIFAHPQISITDFSVRFWPAIPHRISSKNPRFQLELEFQFRSAQTFAPEKFRVRTPILISAPLRHSAPDSHLKNPAENLRKF